MKTIAVIFGGKSAEHDISIMTAIASVIKPLELTSKYNVEAIYIAKDGSWFWDDKLKNIALFQSGDIDDFIRKSPHVQLQLDNGLTLVKSSQFAGRKQYKKIDCVFPAMHGTHGEDGELMGILEMANVPYVGCGVAASAIAMDKILSKQITKSADIESSPWVWFTAHDLERDHNTVISTIQKLKYPLFVKPARLGSSIGISRVEDASQLNNALEVAVHFDDRVIVEEAVPNLIEVTLPIIGNEEPRVAMLERPMHKDEEFFDFDTKYMSGGKKGGKSSGGKLGAQGYSQIPAEIPKELYDQALTVGLNVYKAIGCSGTARVDMLIDSKKEKVYFNEVNPMPGDLYRHNWRQAGLASTDLVEELLVYADERWQSKQKIATSFSTNFLKQF